MYVQSGLRVTVISYDSRKYSVTSEKKILSIMKLILVSNSGTVERVILIFEDKNKTFALIIRTEVCVVGFPCFVWCLILSWHSVGITV